MVNRELIESGTRRPGLDYRRGQGFFLYYIQIGPVGLQSKRRGDLSSRLGNNPIWRVRECLYSYTSIRFHVMLVSNSRRYLGSVP
jgi:hypothetical protein